MKTASLGLSRSPASGRVKYISAKSDKIKVENKAGLLWISTTRRMFTTPFSFLVFSKSKTSKLGSPKICVAPCCSSATMLRRIAPNDAGAIEP